MIIVMRTQATNEQIAHVVDYLHQHGLNTHLSKGVERTIIGVLGAITQDLPESLESVSGVEEVIRVTKPYKLASREFETQRTVIALENGVTIGGTEVIMMAGPCTVETEKQVLTTAELVKSLGAKVLRGGAYKPSTSPYNFRGLGPTGLKILAKAKAETGLAIITEVMTPGDVELVAEYADILQIGTRNMQNFALLEEVGRSKTAVMLKRGMSATIEEWLLAAEYILAKGNRKVMLCERGIRTFEKATRNTMDISAIPLIKRLSHLPIIADPSQGTGKWHLVHPLSAAAVAAGADGLLIEVHPNPDEALKDGAQSLTPESFRKLVPEVSAVAAAIGRYMATRDAVGSHHDY